MWVGSAEDFIEDGWLEEAEILKLIDTDEDYSERRKSLDQSFCAEYKAVLDRAIKRLQRRQDGEDDTAEL